jgi:hypothetical protein
MQLITTTASATAATAPPVTPISPAATSSALARTRFIDDDVPSHEVLAVERLNRAIRLLIVRNFDETEAPKLSRHLIANQCDTRSRNPRLREPVY